MKLSKTGRVVVGMGLVVSCLAWVGWRSIQPKFRFASIAEIRSKFDPRLVAPVTLDAAAQERYRRFAQEMEFPNARYDGVAGKLLAIAKEGPMQLPPEAVLKPESLRVPDVVISSAVRARDGAASDPEGAVAILVEGYELYGLALDAADTETQFYSIINCEGSLAEICRGALPHLREKQLARLLGVVERESLLSSFRRCVIGETQRMIPRLAGISPGSSEPSMAALGIRGEGTYDALATAELLNKMALTKLDASDSPIPKGDYAADAELQKLADSLPEKSYVDKGKGLERKANEWLYHYRLNNSANSWGPYLAGTRCRTALQTLAMARTMRSLLITQIAILLYRERHGVLPTGIDPLVSMGMLTVRPIDYVTGAKLEFDPQKRVLTGSGQTLEIAFPRNR